MPRFSGACHCGAVRFVIDSEITETTSCDCSLCAKKNARMVKVHESELTILSGKDALSLYRWNTGVAKHYFCATCGIYPFHRKRSAPDFYGVNVFCLEGFDVNAVPHRLADGKDMTLAKDAPNPDWPGPRLEKT